MVPRGADPMRLLLLNDARGLWEVFKGKRFLGRVIWRHAIPFRISIKVKR